MNRVCYPMTDVPEYLVGTATAPYGGVYAGDVLMCEDLDNAIVLNFTQYRGEIPTANLLRSRALAIVISGGNFERTADGRMPKGQPDYTKYYYREGETVPVIFLDSQRIQLFISDDCLNGNVNIGQYLVGVDGSKNLGIANEGSEDFITSLKVVAKHNFRVGGIFGGDFASGNICTVLNFRWF